MLKLPIVNFILKIDFCYFLAINTAQKMKLFIKDFFSKCDQMPQFPADLVTFTEEILNGKIHILCSANLQFFIFPT